MLAHATHRVWDNTQIFCQMGMLLFIRVGISFVSVNRYQKNQLLVIKKQFGSISNTEPIGFLVSRKID